MSKRIAAVLAMLVSDRSMPQLATAVSDTELSKEIENPVTRRITLPLRYEADFLDGAYKAHWSAAAELTAACSFEPERGDR